MRSKTTFHFLLCRCVIISMVLCSMASAEAPEKSPLEQVEAMVMLNENGIISVTYAEPWFWEVGYYAMSLVSFMADSLDAAGAECAALSQTLTDYPEQRLSARARRILDSQLKDGRVEDIRLISSVLKKYSRKNEIDRENASEKGVYTPLSGNVCSNLGVETPGYLQQMLPVPQNNPEAFYDPQCVRIEKTAACLDELNLIDKLNRRTKDDEFTEADFSPGLFSVVSGSHADDEV